MLPRGKLMVDMATGKSKPSVKGKTNYRKIKIPKKCVFNVLEVNLQAANVAEVNLPAVDIAEGILPAANADEVHLPAVDVADINLPAVDVAEIILPAVDVADINLPAVDIADINLPAASVAELNLLTADVSEIILPAEGFAEINLPATDVADINLPPIDVAEVNLSTVNIADFNLPAIDDTDFLKGHLNDADDSDFQEGVLLPAKVQEKKNLPAVVVIESSSSVVAEKVNFEQFNFTGEGGFKIGTCHRPRRVKKEKGRAKVRTILEAEISYNEPLFSSGSSDEYQPDSSSGEGGGVSLQVKKAVAKKRVVQHKTSRLNRYIKVNQGDCSSEVAGIKSSSNAEEVMVPDSADVEESLVPASDGKESLVPGSYVKEALVHGKRKRRKGEDIDSKDWARNLNAAKRRTGDSYLGLKKQENGSYALVVKKEERKLKGRCGCKNVRLFDCAKVSEIERKKLFTNFWKEIDSWEAKQATVVSLVSKSKPSFRRGSTDADNSRKSSSFQYHLKVGDDKVRVCKEMFLNTFCLGEKSVRSWVLKSALDKPLCEQNNHIYVDDPQPMEDNVQTPSAKYTEKRNGIREFLNALPKMESHYCRANTTKVYLEPMWESKSQLFREYVRNCQDKDVEPGSRALFHTIFQAMNIGFFLPKKDQCETCLKYIIGKFTDEEYENHQKRKVDARSEKDSDKKRGESSNQVLVYAVDVQKVLTCPDIRASVAYYKTKLKVHNWSAYNLATHDGTCYIWHEGNASLESDVFASMLVRFLTKELEKNPGIREIIIWSDGCTYQNRCENVANALLYLAIKKGVIVYQKYLEVGHTQMEVDSMHSIIEKKLKKQEHYVPADFVRAIRNARMVPRPYTVESLSYKDFYSFSNGYYKSIRPGSKKGDPFVTDLRCLKYNPTGHIFYKLNFSEEWSELPKRPKPMDDVFTNLKPLYSNPLSIQDRKFKDLQELKNCLEEDYHHFYDSLRHG